MESKARQVYNRIWETAKSYKLVQGVSALWGFPFTLVADAVAIFTHFGTMHDEIRKIYGRGHITKSEFISIIESCKTEILADVVMSKGLGQIPVIGVPSKVMCAKMTAWRLGLLFGLLEASGEEISPESATNAMKAIRAMFPQSNPFEFSTPPADTVEKFLTKFEDCDAQTFDAKVGMILEAMDVI